MSDSRTVEESLAELAPLEESVDEHAREENWPVRTPGVVKSAPQRITVPVMTPEPIPVWERAAYRFLFRRMGLPAVALKLRSGEVLGALASPEQIVIRSPTVWRRLLANPCLGFGEAYMDGDLELCGDLVTLCFRLNEALSRGTTIRPNDGFWWRLMQGAWHTLAQSRDSVARHYDLGNEFYKLWLDPQLVYTCAYYASPEMSLDEAQSAKLEYVCRKLRLQPGECVAEAGCGWGALALHMAKHHGVRVRAWNLSKEQIQFARERVRREGLEGRVEFIQDDYRALTGKYDAVVSVGMLEHVGTEHYIAFGRLMDRVLTPNGRGLIHSIGRNWARPLDPWTLKYIFPGACPGSLKQMLDMFETSGFSVVDVENLRRHYARTCADWLRKFEQVAPQVEEQFDQRFVRMWRLYLAASSAAFLSGDLQLFQIVFNRATDNTGPLTRVDWYARPLEARG